MKSSHDNKRDEKKDKVAPKVGIAAGATIAGTGAFIHGTGKYWEKKLAKLSKAELESRPINTTNPTILKRRGAVIIPIGAGVAALSAYAHYKNKKDSKKNDNNKK